jgi:hypothetical protein
LDVGFNEIFIMNSPILRNGFVEIDKDGDLLEDMNSFVGKAEIKRARIERALFISGSACSFFLSLDQSRNHHVMVRAE